MEIDEEVFLSHYGKKGMKWGQRSAKQRAAIVGGGAAGFNLGAIGLGVFAKTANANINPLLSLGVQAGAAYAGIRTVKYVLDKEGNKKLPKKPTSTNPA